LGLEMTGRCIRFLKSIPRIVLILSAPVVLVLLALLVGIVFRVPISLNSLRPTIEISLESFLGRKVAIAGAVDLVMGIYPGIRVTDVEIMNPIDWPGGEGEEGIAKIESLRADVVPTRLLRRQIVLKSLKVEGVSVALIEREDGAVNWNFGDVAVSSDGDEEAEAASAEGGGYVFAGLRDVAIRDFELFFTDPGDERRSLL
jgi:uncharacterized protein involved in outer membrane biogenesis